MFESLARIKDRHFIDDLNNYCNDVSSLVKRNVSEALNSKYVRSKCGIFSNDEYTRMFTATGAIKTNNISELGESRHYFIDEPDRMLAKSSKTENCILRGPRYLVAIDPRLSIPQKLKIIFTDIHDGIEYLNRMFQKDHKRQYKAFSPILDYVKNGIITLTNAYIQGEKTGDLKLDDKEYQTIRKDLIEAGSYVTYLFYLSLLNKIDTNNLSIQEQMAKVNRVVIKVHRILEMQYKEFTLSSRAIVRPEASHPLLMLGFTSLILKRVHDVDTVIGLPSGGTELAYLVSRALNRERHTQCKLILVPVSMHSLQVQYGRSFNSALALQECWGQYHDNVFDKNILVVDDNSSSGSTISAVCKSIRAFCTQAVIHVSVMEADLHRTKLDADNLEKRQHYADASIYRNSIGILPISRKIWFKHDLKEVIETFSLARHFKKIAKHSTSRKTRVKYEVFYKEAKEPFYRLGPIYKGMDKIDSFQGTFLSNFASARIVHDGKTFQSVEHAYQYSKFESHTFQHLPVNVLAEINEILDSTEHYSAENVASIFTSDSSPGVVKKISEILRKYGFVRDNWDEMRVDILTGLLLKKFEIPEMSEALRATGENTYLVEGNTWNDTFWGVCDGRGRNLLGLILMNIRKKIIDEIF